jgi:hypothetical protein
VVTEIALDIEKLFRRREHVVYVRLALEGWSELPPVQAEEWQNLVWVLKAVNPLGSEVLEAAQNGDDLYLWVELSRAASTEGLVEALRSQLSDPCWQPYLNSERYRWLGGYHVWSLRPEDRLDSLPLEHPARTWKRKWMQQHIGRTLDHPWHDAPSPEAVGISVRACVEAGSLIPRRTRIYLLYAVPEQLKKEAFAAAQLNFRISVPGTSLRIESEGWESRNAFQAVVFHVPNELLVNFPDELEIWWQRDRRELIARLPCFKSGTEPEDLREQRPWLEGAKGD